jgi:hypothetical protein
MKHSPTSATGIGDKAHQQLDNSGGQQHGERSSSANEAKYGLGVSPGRELLSDARNSPL